VIQTFDYLFAGLLGADLTAKQGVFFRFVARLMLALPEIMGRNATILDMIALAGGLNQFAARTKIFVLRPDGTVQKRLPFNYNKAVTAGGEQENFYLQSGDIIVVP
jgi:hypothetical protein